MHIDGKVFIIIPCYNEAECIISVVKELRANVGDAHIVLVDDASSDSTNEIIQSILDEKMTLLSLATNLGIGGAVQAGFIYAVQNDAEYAVKFDGDGQHPADKVYELLIPLITKEADFVIGSRFINGNNGFKSTFIRRIGIRFFSIINSLLLKQVVVDNTSGFRAYSKLALAFVAKYYPSFDYPEPEEVVLLVKNGFRLKEIAVPMRNRLSGCSSIRLNHSVYFMIKVTFAILMTAMRSKIRE